MCSEPSSMAVGSIAMPWSSSIAMPAPASGTVCVTCPEATKSMLPSLRTFASSEDSVHATRDSDMATEAMPKTHELVLLLICFPLSRNPARGRGRALCSL